VSQKIFTRDFALCFLAQFFFSIGLCSFIPTLPIYFAKLGASEAEIGILVGALSVSALVLRPLVGKGLLRVPEKTFMIAGSSIFTLSSISYLFFESFWLLIIIRLFQGIGLAFYATSSWALAARIIPEARRGQGLSYFYLSLNTAFALAPSIGMFLVNQFNFITFFLVSTGLCLGSLCITSQLRSSQATPANDPSEEVQHQGFLSRKAFPAATISLMGNFTFGTVTAFFPLFALGHGMKNPGFFFGALAMTLILGRAFGGKVFDLYNREKVILPCLAIQIVAMTILAFSTTFPMFMLTAVVWGMGNAFLYPSLMAYILDRTGSSRGPAIGTYLAVSDLGSGMGPVIMGIILELSNYRTMFLGLVLISLLNFGYFCRIVIRRRKDQHANLRVSL